MFLINITKSSLKQTNHSFPFSDSLIKVTPIPKIRSTSMTATTTDPRAKLPDTPLSGNEALKERSDYLHGKKS